MVSMFQKSVQWISAITRYFTIQHINQLYFNNEWMIIDLSLLPTLVIGRRILTAKHRNSTMSEWLGEIVSFKLIFHIYVWVNPKDIYISGRLTIATDCGAGPVTSRVRLCLCVIIIFKGFLWLKPAWKFLYTGTSQW